MPSFGLAGQKTESVKVLIVVAYLYFTTWKAAGNLARSRNGRFQEQGTDCKRATPLLSDKAETTTMDGRPTDDDETRQKTSSINIDTVCPVWTDIGFQHYFTFTATFDEVAERMMVG